MRFLNNLIAILAIKILFLKVNIWHVNAIHSPDTLSDLLTKYNTVMHTFNNSKCAETTSNLISRMIPYTETYKDIYDSAFFYRLRTRWNFRKQFNWTRKCVKCVEGYVLSGEQCVPHCSRSCEKGICKEPNVCICNKGYHMSSNDTCVPECTNGCVNGTCIDPEICSCNEGYWMDSDGFTCRPVCDEECERNYGFCLEPNVCTCRLGYRKIGNDSSSCEPVCHRTCINGKCTAPDICACTKGYEADRDEPFICKPKCRDEPCIFETCTAPRTCTCDHGYRTVNESVCEPICSEPCQGGKCVAPETCSCNEGYKPHDKFKYICELKPCEIEFYYDERYICKRQCKQIECGDHRKCIKMERNKCDLITGNHLHLPENHLQIVTLRPYRNWKNHILPNLSEPVDQPICDFECTNGKCIAPNICVCYPGHSPRPTPVHHPLNGKIFFCQKRDKSTCNETSCGDNGKCHVRSGVCICNDGYTRDTDNDCVPFCDPRCNNGTCTAPNRCECHDGFAMQNDSLCKPICERGCQNGDCIGPNHCVCHDDFIPNNDHHSGPECIPVCTRNCSGHGECVTDSNNNYRCECQFGWTGWDCDQPTMCIVTMDYDPDNRVTIRNEENDTIVRAFDNAPFCYQCDNSLDNETLCYIIYVGKNNTENIGCLLSTDLPCYTKENSLNYNASTNATVTVWPFMILVILLIIGSTVAYLIYRKRQKKKLTIGTSANISMRNNFSTEFLLPDN